jgi:hypothetical protein
MHLRPSRRVPIAGITVALAVTIAIGLGALAPGGAATASWRTLTYGQETFKVPGTWKLFDVARSPKTCVRFNRNAVYEGASGPLAACPAEATGISDAIQVQPYRHIAKWEKVAALVPSTLNGQQVLVSSNDRITHRLVAAFPAGGTIATISFVNNRAVAEAILQTFHSTRRNLDRTVRNSSSAQVKAAFLGRPAGGRSRDAAPAASAARHASITASLTTRGGARIYVGKGFDACGAPSEGLMNAWLSHSPYRSIGVYLGGVNAACPPDTSTFASWVSTELRSGWTLFPLYVGLQAPCVFQGGLATISSSSAASQGAGAADNAVNEAQSYGIGLGSTVYYDMEGWNTNDTGCNNTVLSFVRGWTTELHRRGYRSGFYSSLDAGINVIESIWGSASAPDDIDIAAWNGIPSTNGYVPSNEWPHNQRIHQYIGGTTVSYGGYSLNIDADYLDAPTVGLGGDPVRPAVVSITPPSSATGTRVTVTGSGFVPGGTEVLFGGVAGGHVNVSSSSRLTVAVPPRAPASVDITVKTAGGTSAVAARDRFRYIPIVGLAVDPRTGGYYVATARGNVYSFNAPWYGSLAASRRPPAPVIGIGVDWKTGGYYLTTSAGKVYAFAAPRQPSAGAKIAAHRVVSIATDPVTGGYYLATSKGRVYDFGAPHQPAIHAAMKAPVVDMALDQKTGGYYLTTTRGNVFDAGAPWLGSLAHHRLPAPVVGIAAEPGSGYFLATSKGNVYNFGATWKGSTARTSLTAPVRDIAVVPSSGGYLLVTSTGNVYSFGTNWYGSPAANGR